MLNIRKRTDTLFKSLYGGLGRLSHLHLVRKVIFSLLTLQVLIAAVLIVIAALGKRRKHEVSFPHDPFEEVQVGENVLRLYAYGRDLYDAMLEAIDAAQESIYLETYIWKDDAVGQEFRMHLARKAAEGVAVYVIFDRFGNLVVPRAFKSSFAPPIHVLQYSAIRGICLILVATRSTTASCSSWTARRALSGATISDRPTQRSGAIPTWACVAPPRRNSLCPSLLSGIASARHMSGSHIGITAAST